MTLEFNQIVDQVYKMGAMLDKLDFDLSHTLELARGRFEAASDLSAVWERIDWVRRTDISGYRGAAPLDGLTEPINARIPPPNLPDYATIIAGDGSQVYPDEQAPVHYYLLNLGLFVFHHGTDRIPEQRTIPRLYYHEKYVHDRYGRIIQNRVVDERRTVAEMKALAKEAWERRRAGDNKLIVALYDNQLMFLPGEPAHPDDEALDEYFSALVHMHDAGGLLVGYVDNPFRSLRFMQLLYLLSMENEEQAKLHQRQLSRAGDLEGLRDQVFFSYILQPGERSAIMVQNSPQNLYYRQRGQNYEVAFFYLKVDNPYQSRVVRVDLPAWVARDHGAVDAIHALLLNQCRLQGRNPYPYALTRADELAYVSGKDRSKLEQLIGVQVRRVRDGQGLIRTNAKVRGKQLARSSQRYFNISGDLEVDRD